MAETPGGVSILSYRLSFNEYDDLLLELKPRMREAVLIAKAYLA